MLTITVNDLNEAPTELALSNDTIAEDAANGTIVGALSTTDPDAGNTHTPSVWSPARAIRTMHLSKS
ncbi:MAG TPA: hypothetical protein VMM76_08445 [Pirellulaceae bacterium]|nr:hypothetical protein [Pirellulaceae bacterium]